MRIKALLATFLSFGLGAVVGCAGTAILPDQPDGWSCAFFYNKEDPVNSSFLCNRIRNPEIAKEFLISDPFIFGAKAMDIESFQAYSNYVFKLRAEVIECRGQN